VVAVGSVRYYREELEARFVYWEGLENFPQKNNLFKQFMKYYLVGILFVLN